MNTTSLVEILKVTKKVGQDKRNISIPMPASLERDLGVLANLLSKPYGGKISISHLMRGICAYHIRALTMDPGIGAVGENQEDGVLNDLSSSALLEALEAEPEEPESSDDFVSQLLGDTRKKSGPSWGR